MFQVRRQPGYDTAFLTGIMLEYCEAIYVVVLISLG